MPIISKYSNKEINNLVNEVLESIQDKELPVDVALVVLGNTVSNIIDANVSAEKKQVIAQSFADALLASMKN